MKYVVIALGLGVLVLAGCMQMDSESSDAQNKTTKAPVSFHTLQAQSIDGKTVKMSDYKGKYILVVNTASKCGYTYQYEGLEKLHEKYKDKLVVLGFPSNDFLWQEPGNNEKIKSFCSLNYGVTFPMFAKIEVKGKNKHQVYEWLTNPKLNGWNSSKPSWNFNKYLIDPKGNLVKHFGSKVEPLSEQIVNYIN